MTNLVLTCESSQSRGLIGFRCSLCRLCLTSKPEQPQPLTVTCANQKTNLFSFVWGRNCYFYSSILNFGIFNVAFLIFAVFNVVSVCLLPLLGFSLHCLSNEMLVFSSAQVGAGFHIVFPKLLHFPLSFESSPICYDLRTCKVMKVFLLVVMLFTNFPEFMNTITDLQ